MIMRNNISLSLLNGFYNSLSNSALLPPICGDTLGFSDLSLSRYTAQTAHAVGCAVFRRANNLNINNKNN